MKKINLILLGLAFLGFSACEKETTEGLSKVTNYPLFDVSGASTVYVEEGGSFTDPGVVATENGQEIEVTTTASGYTGGGNTLVASADPVLSGDTACVKFNTTTWGSSASFTARGCLIYNTTSITGFTANRSVCAVNFGSDKTVTSGTFTIQFPAQTAGNAIVQIAQGVTPYGNR